MIRGVEGPEVFWEWTGPPFLADTIPTEGAPIFAVFEGREFRLPTS